MKSVINNKLILAIVITIVTVGIGMGIYLSINNNNDSPKKDSQKSIVLNFDSSLCDQIPETIIEKAIGKDIIKTDTLSNSTTNTCQYFVDENSFVTLRLNRLDFETQKKGQQALDRTISKNGQIEIEHFIATQENGLINDIVFKINDDTLLAVDRSSTNAANETDIVKLAIEVANFLGNSDNAETTQENSDTAIVPEPQETDIIRNFFQLIEEKEVSKAVLAMSSRNTDDDSTKQAWGVQFNDINSVKVISVEASPQDDWTESKHTYKTVLDIVMDPSSANEPIPYYGYENGQNTRFISIIKEDGLWKVDEIATGP